MPQPAPQAANPSDKDQELLPLAHPGMVTVDLEAITHNIARLRDAAPGTELMAVVKADAYGHGLRQVALAALDAGATWLGVAQAREALDLRKALDEAGVARAASPILAWISAPRSDLEPVIWADIDLGVSTLETLGDVISGVMRARTADAQAGLSQAASGNSPTKAPRRARIHLKVDTGMSRAGATLEDWPTLVTAARAAADAGLVEIVGIFSHLSRADDPTPAGEASTIEHIRRFHQALEIAADLGVEPQLRHLAATSGILWHPDAHFDMVRAGIGMYGLSPDPSVATSTDLGLRPAMRVEGRLTSVKTVEADEGVSYGATWRTPGERWLGLVPLGYADGILRTASNRAWVHINTAHGPIEAPQVGRICMDQFVVDLGPVAETGAEASADEPPPPARIGDLVVLIGDPTAGEPSADSWAEAASTINYEVTTRIGDRLSRRWIGGRATKPAPASSDNGQR